MTATSKNSARKSAAPTRNAKRTQVRGDHTRASIVDETVRCVLDEGFAAASAKHVAERAGVTWGVIQYHFGDRDGLLMAVVDAGWDELRHTLANVTIPAGSTKERVEAVVRSAWAAFSSPVSMAALEILVATRADRHREANAHLEELARALNALGDALAPDANEALGEVLWAALRGLVLARMVVPSSRYPTRELAAITRLLTTQLEITSDAARSAAVRTSRPGLS
jgi:AcrR family transcriptional regulator